MFTLIATIMCLVTIGALSIDGWRTWRNNRSRLEVLPYPAGVACVLVFLAALWVTG